MLPPVEPVPVLPPFAALGEPLVAEATGEAAGWSLAGVCATGAALTRLGACDWMSEAAKGASTAVSAGEAAATVAFGASTAERLFASLISRVLKAAVRS